MTERRMTVPGARLIVPTAAAWHARADAMLAVHCSAMWWVGDFLAAAPTVEAKADWLTSDPRVCSSTTAAAEALARRFPPGTEHPTRPWSHHEQAAGTADPHGLLEHAAARGWSRADLRRAKHQGART